MISYKSLIHVTPTTNGVPMYNVYMTIVYKLICRWCIDIIYYIRIICNTIHNN